MGADASHTLLTVKEAKRLRSPVVYGLAGLDGVIFYVGQTISPERRFQTHSEAKPQNYRLRDRLRALGKNLRVVILAHDPADLTATEYSEISSRAGLLNLVRSYDEAWAAAHTSTPWSAKPGVHSPTSFALKRLDASRAAHVRAILKTMPAHVRCALEIETLRSMPPAYAARFTRWLDITRDKMLACLEAA